MNNNDDEISKNKNEIKKTLNEANYLANSANTYVNILNKKDNNNTSINKTNEKNTRKISFRKIKEEKEEGSDISDENNAILNEEDDEGIYTIEYLSNQIVRYSQKVEKYDGQVKKNLLLSKKYPDRAEEYKDEAIRALKKKKFYNKALESYEKRKLKLDLKNLDKEFEIQKKELKKLTKEFKKKVALVTMGEEYDEKNEENYNEDNNDILDQVDIDEKTLNQQYEDIIFSSDVLKENENLNLFKFIFQEE